MTEEKEQPELVFHIPDLLHDWPCQYLLSPYYHEAKQESSLWVASYHPFDRKGQAAFDGCDLNLLASLTYSNRNEEFIRLGCDLMNFFFVYDEYTDVASPEVAHQLSQIAIDAMKFPDTSSAYGEHILGEMTRDFWRRACALANRSSNGTKSQACLDKFIGGMETYFKAVVVEARDRVEGRVHTVEDYLQLRRDTSAAYPTLSFIEFGLDLDNDVLNHPAVKALTAAAAEMIVLVNDMHSFVREINSGSDHNLITSIMHEHGLDYQAAFDWLGNYSDEIVARFNAGLDELPTFGDDVDRRLKIYIEGLAQWVRGEDDWSYESKRYYGNDGLNVRETRRVKFRSTEGSYLNL